MSTFIIILIGLIALLHVYFFILEAFLWNTAIGRKAFNTTSEQAATTHVMAINQGVYNLFLAGGLAWSLVVSDPLAFQLQVFFLSCVVIAGLVGGLTAMKRILLIQALPAAAALIFVVVFKSF